MRNLCAVLCAIFMLSPLAIAKGKQSLPKDYKLKGLFTKKPADLKGQYTILQFWAHWCVTCNKTMRVMGSFSKKQPVKVNFVTISVDEEMSDAKAYILSPKKRVKKFKKKSYLDVGAKLATGLDIEAIPSVVLLSPKGKVLKVIAGHPTKKKLNELKALIKAKRQQKIAARKSDAIVKS